MFVSSSACELNAAQMQTPALAVEHVSKSFLRRTARSGWAARCLLPAAYKTCDAVTNVSFSIFEGECVGLLGCNGCGKSTLIRILATLLLPDSGEVRAFGLDVSRFAAEVRRMTARVCVEASFNKCLPAEQNLRFHALLHGRTPGGLLERAREMLAGFNLKNGAMQQQVRELSRGAQQKLAITRALLLNPRLLLMDEPTTGLDPLSKEAVHRFLARYLAEQGTAMLLTTHDMDEAELLCDRILFMRGGCIVAEGTADELKARVGAGASLKDAFRRFAGDPDEVAPDE